MDGLVDGTSVASDGLWDGDVDGANVGSLGLADGNSDGLVVGPDVGQGPSHSSHMAPSGELDRPSEASHALHVAPGASSLTHRVRIT